MLNYSILSVRLSKQIIKTAPKLKLYANDDSHTFMMIKAMPIIIKAAWLVLIKLT